MTSLVVLVIVGGAALLAAGVTAAVYRRLPDRVADRVDADRAARLAADLRRSAGEWTERHRPRPLDDVDVAAVKVGGAAPVFQPDPAQGGTAGTAPAPVQPWPWGGND